MNAARYGLSQVHREWMTRLGLAGVCSVLLLVFLVIPELRKIRDARDEAASLQETYRAMRDNPDYADLDARIRRIDVAYDRLLRRSRKLRHRYNVLASPADASAEARIDFKVALQEARERIQGKAHEKGYQYPESLGMTETIAAEENAETRMRQLQAGIQAAELCFEIEISHMQSLRPLTPVLRRPAAGGHGLWTVDYPVEVQISCRYDQLVTVLDSLRQTLRFFSLYSMTASHPGPNNPDMLAVRLILGMGRFQNDDPAADPLSPRGPDAPEPVFPEESS